MISEVSDARLAFLEQLQAAGVVVMDETDATVLHEFLVKLGLREGRDIEAFKVKIAPHYFPARATWKAEGWCFRLSHSVRIVYHKKGKTWNRNPVEVRVEDTFVAPPQRTA